MSSISTEKTSEKKPVEDVITPPQTEKEEQVKKTSPSSFGTATTSNILRQRRSSRKSSPRDRSRSRDSITDEVEEDEQGENSGDTHPLLFADHSRVDEPPQEYCCPITHEIMIQPVMAKDGHTYEESAIKKWFSGGQTRSPITNEELQDQSLIPNHLLRKFINEFRRKKGLILLNLLVTYPHTSPNKNNSNKGDHHRSTTINTNASRWDHSSLQRKCTDLLQSGADPNVKLRTKSKHYRSILTLEGETTQRHSGLGATPLLIILCNSQLSSSRIFSLTKLFISHGADLSLKDDEGFTPLAAATKRSQLSGGVDDNLCNLVKLLRNTEAKQYREKQAEKKKKTSERSRWRAEQNQRRVQREQEQRRANPFGGLGSLLFGGFGGGTQRGGGIAPGFGMGGFGGGRGPGMQFGNVQVGAGFGLFPGLFGFQFQFGGGNNNDNNNANRYHTNNNANGNPQQNQGQQNNGANNLEEERRQQENTLAFMLIMMGVFVLFSLLMN
eukprot:g4304.t1